MKVGHAPLLLPLALAFVLAGGCKKEGPTEAPAASEGAPVGVARCQKGIQRAVAATTLTTALSTYYEECANLHTEATCRDAWHTAASAALDEQPKIVAEACRTAYCGKLGSSSFELCRSDFALSKEAVERAWPPFFEAVINHEAGPYSAELMTSLLVFYVRSAQLRALPGAAGSGAAAPSAAPGAPSAPIASAGSAPSAAPAASGAPSASGAPPPSAPPPAKQ